MTITRDQMPYCVGWQPADPDPRTLRLATYRPEQLPPAPVSADWLGKVRHWPMLLNDEIGDCEPVACAHLAQAWTANAGPAAYEPVDADVLTAYEQISGYNPAAEQPDGSNPTDRGCTSLGTLNYWRRAGIGGHRIVAYAAVNTADHAEVKAALNVFGGLLFAANLPLAAGMQTRKRQTWRPTPGPSGVPGSWGGHALHLGGYGPRTLTCITWGATQRLSWAWWDQYVAEAYAIVTPDWLNTAGESPGGLNIAALLDDLRKVTAH